jgi:hypothetical protein
MKSLFPGYYSPSEEQFKALWKNGIVVLDTNVLLELYRLPQRARDELVAALSSMQQRLWIPHQVALEFQRNRVNVIAAERSRIDDVVVTAEKNFQGIRTAIADLKLDRRGLELDMPEMENLLEKASEAVTRALRAAQAAQPDISSSDEIREKIDALFEDRIGSPPTSLEEISALCADSERRMQQKIAPGYLDSEKGKGADEGKFSHHGIQYDRRLGDLILWRQVLKHAEISGTKYLMLVTGDQKEDWWWREKGRTFGPKQDLVQEIRSVSKVETFWMYTPEQFLKNAQTYAQAQVSQASLDQLKEIQEDTWQRVASKKVVAQSTSDERSPTDLPIRAVRKWLAENYGLPSRRRLEGAPNILAYRDGEIVGYHVVDISMKTVSSQQARLMSASIQLATEKRDGRVHEAHLVICSDEASPQINTYLQGMVKQGDIDSMVWGTIVGETYVDTNTFTA